MTDAENWATYEVNNAGACEGHFLKDGQIRRRNALIALKLDNGDDCWTRAGQTGPSAIERCGYLTVYNGVHRRPHARGNRISEWNSDLANCRMEPQLDEESPTSVKVMFREILHKQGSFDQTFSTK